MKKNYKNFWLGVLTGTTLTIGGAVISAQVMYASWKANQPDPCAGLCDVCYTNGFRQSGYALEDCYNIKSAYLNAYQQEYFRNLKCESKLEDCLNENNSD